MNNDIKYLDNQYIRSFSSNIFNFILDKESNVSIYWGHDQNDDPLYDIIGPQELTISVNNNITEQNLFKTINLLANIQEEKQKNVKYENVLNKDVEYLMNNINLKAISTTNTIIFDYDNNTDIDVLNNIIKYIKSFNFTPIIQFKDAISDELIQKLKFISPNINLYFNENTIETYKTLTKAKFRVDVKIHVDNNNYRFIIENLKVLSKDVKGRLYIDEPFINKLQLSELENRIKNLKLNSIYLYACNLYKFNDSQDKPFKHILEIINCDACCFSLYVKDNKIYPCENKLDKELAVINKQKHIDQLWDKNKEIKKFREQIVDKTYC